MFVLDPSVFEEGKPFYNMLTFNDTHILAMEVIEAIKSSSAVDFNDIASEMIEKMNEKMEEKKKMEENN